MSRSTQKSPEPPGVGDSVGDTADEGACDAEGGDVDPEHPARPMQAVSPRAAILMGSGT